MFRGLLLLGGLLVFTNSAFAADIQMCPKGQMKEICALRIQRDFVMDELVQQLVVVWRAEEQAEAKALYWEAYVKGLTITPEKGGRKELK